MERHVNAGQGNSSEATLELYVALVLLKLERLLVGVVDDLAQHLLDLVHGERFCELYTYLVLDEQGENNGTYLYNVNLLQLEEVEDVRHCLKGDEFASAHVLLAL